jgi:ribosome-binding factor A
MNTPTTRQLKIAKLIQKEFAAILLHEGKSLCGNAVVTVTGVEISKDFSFARIFLSLYAVKDKQQMLDMLEGNKKELRFRLGQRIKNQIRSIPEIAFALDDTLDYIENIDNLLKN